MSDSAASHYPWRVSETRLESCLRFAWRARSLRDGWRWSKLFSARRIPADVVAYVDELERRCEEAGLYGKHI